MEYPKIHSLWKRKSEKDSTFIRGDYSCEEFGLISRWRVEEKIDGTNVRVVFDPNAENGDSINFYGRSKDSQMPQHLYDFLKGYFTYERLSNAFGDTKTRIILYGEGYGNTIQAMGPSYRKDVGFMLFDILVGNWWFARKTLQEKAALLEVPLPPDLGIMTEAEIIEFITSRPESKCSIKPQVLEGVIARPEPLLLFRSGKPVVWKLKVRDFYGEKN